MRIAELKDGKFMCRNMTEEEIVEMERKQAEIPEMEPTLEERLDEMETTTDDIILLMAELIGGM